MATHNKEQEVHRPPTPDVCEVQEVRKGEGEKSDTSSSSPAIHKSKRDCDDKTVREVGQKGTHPAVSEVPDGGWGWMVVAGSTLTHLLLVGMARSFGVLYVLLLLYFNSSNAATAWVTAIFNMVRTLNGRSNKYIIHVCTFPLCKQVSK